MTPLLRAVVGMALTTATASPALSRDHSDPPFITLEKRQLGPLVAYALVPPEAPGPTAPLRIERDVFTLTAATGAHVYTNDAKHRKARAEIKLARTLAPGARAISSMDMRLPSLVAPDWTIVQQWHQGGHSDTAPGNPPLSLQLLRNHPGELHAILRQQAGPKSPHVRFVDLGALPVTAGNWHRIEQAVNWSMGKAGRVRIWVDGHLSVDFEGALGYDRSHEIAFKFGVYRAQSSRESRLDPWQFTAEFRNIHLNSKG